ncbi:hypothetical protein cyc_01472 [Cyclospora cayetanensis]|uniref:Uncharacterized protein n=1 Tax=Cyclospora cayetanensis TaxID=88456 RepID=A0A1D3D6V0_9EIME|nr:hypothetical protein cyc_01472 [Cyclospora cayetanensis]
MTTPLSGAKNGATGSGSSGGSLNLYKANLVRAHCIGALLWSLGLRYAGSGNSAVVLMLLQYYSAFASARIGRTGRQDVFSVLLRERHRLSTSGSSDGKGYADQLLLHHCVGLLFMGGCQWSLQRDSSLAVAALVLSLQPLPTGSPTDACGSKLLLQAERHLYALAAEPRFLRAAEVNSGKAVSLPVELLLVRPQRAACRDSGTACAAAADCSCMQAYDVHRVWLPASLPEASSILGIPGRSQMQRQLDAAVRSLCSKDVSAAAAELLALLQECAAEDKLYALPLLQHFSAVAAEAEAAGGSGASNSIHLEPQQLRELRLLLQLSLPPHAEALDGVVSSSSNSSSTGGGPACKELVTPLVTRPLLLRCSNGVAQALRSKGASHCAFLAYYAGCLHATSRAAAAAAAGERRGRTIPREMQPQSLTVLLQAASQRQEHLFAAARAALKECVDREEPPAPLGGRVCCCPTGKPAAAQTQLRALLQSCRSTASAAYVSFHALPLLPQWIRAVALEVPVLLRRLLQDLHAKTGPLQQRPLLSTAVAAMAARIAVSAAPAASAEGQQLLQSAVRHFSHALLLLLEQQQQASPSVLSAARC